MVLACSSSFWGSMSRQRSVVKRAWHCVGSSETHQVLLGRLRIWGWWPTIEMSTPRHTRCSRRL